ncbi:MAG: ferredoxin family protein [Acidobacteriota bacterium]|nr:ferredoxin family protein [Acidobacteriota bacterium]MDH3524694.1 ferredoxin family protein [Acidobacteriota bacterium]
MAYVIGERCLGERYADCVEVCPVDCIYPGEYQGQEFMVIDPDLCIDCSLCKPACPIDAIFETEDEDPEWAAINAQLSPEWADNDPVPVRPRDDPPRRPENKIINP